jgi:hypothetical protein
MDYGPLFLFAASVDWLAFEIETAGPRHGDTIFEACRLQTYVRPLDKGPGGVATRFVVTFQDVRCWGDAHARLHRLAARFPLASEPIIAGIEVSFDAYARSGTQSADLVDMAVRFFTFGNVVADYRASGIWHNGVEVQKVEAVMSSHDARRLLRNDRVINIGDRDDDVTQRVYFKTTDNGTPLPVAEHRARAEVTLRGAALPFTTLAEARSFDFKTLAKPKPGYFRYRKQRGGLEPLRSLIHSRYAQVGKREERRTANRSRRLYDGDTQADTALNQRARKALGRLTDTMRRPYQAGGNPDFF